MKNALSELASKVADLTKSEKERIELNKLQSQVEFEYQIFKSKINQLETGRAEALSEMQKLKDHYNEILFSFNENVEASVKVDFSH